MPRTPSVLPSVPPFEPPHPYLGGAGYGSGVVGDGNASLGALEPRLGAGEKCVRAAGPAAVMSHSIRSFVRTSKVKAY